MIRNHAQHADAALERARLARELKHQRQICELEEKLAEVANHEAHEQAIRESERWRIAATLVSTDCRPADDWPGCVD